MYRLVALSATDGVDFVSEADVVAVDFVGVDTDDWSWMRHQLLCLYWRTISACLLTVHLVHARDLLCIAAEPNDIVVEFRQVRRCR